MGNYRYVENPSIKEGSQPRIVRFDGDELNIHAAQTPEARFELSPEGTMNVINCIMNAQTNKPIMGAVMDTVSGSFRLTQPGVMVDPKVYHDALLSLTNTDDLSSLNQRLEQHQVPIYSGKALFSSLLPEDFYYMKDSVVIVDGVLMQGAITSSHIGTAHKSIIQVLWNDYGRHRTVDFMTDINFLINRWLEANPLSIGISDCSPTDPNLKQELEEEITKVKLQVMAIDSGIQITDPLEKMRVENEIMGKVNVVKNVGDAIVDKNLEKTNAFYVMSKSGAKGKSTNVAQIIGIGGQKTVSSARMPLDISGGKRCLPHFRMNDPDPEARGFCTSNFRQGLSGPQAFFDAASGREGLTDTAIKTQDTGHIHRELVKGLEDVIVVIDGSVRHQAEGTIFQFTYGDDGFDAAELEKVQTSTFGDIVSFIDLNRVSQRLNHRYGFSQF